MKLVLGIEKLANGQKAMILYTERVKEGNHLFTQLSKMMGNLNARFFL